MNRRHLLARLPALGAVLAGVGLAAKPNHRARRISPELAAQLDDAYASYLRGEPAIPWAEVQAEARAQGFGAAELALVSNRQLSPAAEERAVARLQANGAIPGEPYQGPDNGPRLSVTDVSVSGPVQSYRYSRRDAAGNWQVVEGEGKPPAMAAYAAAYRDGSSRPLSELSPYHATTWTSARPVGRET